MADVAHRKTELTPVEDALVSLPASEKVAWERYLVEAILSDRLPDDFALVVAEIAEFARPLIDSDRARTGAN